MSHMGRNTASAITSTTPVNPAMSTGSITVEAFFAMCFVSRA